MFILMNDGYKSSEWENEMVRQPDVQFHVPTRTRKAMKMPSRTPWLQPIWFFCAGILFLGLGFSLLWLEQTPAAAQDAIDLSDADYIGASECSSCHRDLARRHDDTRHGLALIDTSRDKDPILADFSVGAELRQVQFPGEDAPRAFEADDIAYVIGSGRYSQRYLYEVDRGDNRVLPAEWDVAAGAWRPLSLANSWDDPAYDWETNCAYCHTTGLNLENGRWKDDGVQCESCHGPGEIHEELASDAGRNPDEEELVNIRAAINPATDPQVCGQCHSRGATAEGQPFPVGFRPGSDLSAAFTLSTTDQTDHWWSSGHASQANMQFNEWSASAHASSLSSLRESEQAEDSCLRCHSSDYAYTQRLIAAVESEDRGGQAPAPATLDSAQFGVGCISCHNPHSEAAFDFNLVQEPATLCADCHTNTPEGIHHPSKEMFEGVDFVEGISGFVGAHFGAEDGPTCASCHLPSVPISSGGERSSHTFAPVLAFDVEGLPDSCSSCHEDQASPENISALIAAIQTDTQARLETARAAVIDATPAWVTQALDFVEGDGSLGVHNYTYADALLDAVYEELGLYTTEAGQ